MKRKLSVVILLLLALVLSACSKNEEKTYFYYNTYTEIATPVSRNECTHMQGFALDSDYAYSIKIKSDDSLAIIYKTKLSSGTTRLMTNGDDETTLVNYLGHANDMTLAVDGDEKFMFIVTMKQGANSLVKLKYEDNTYYKAGTYNIYLDGKPTSMSAIALRETKEDSYELIFKRGNHFYQGLVGKDLTKGVVEISELFVGDLTSAKIDGKLVPEIATEFVNQGLAYYNDTIYYPLTYGNISVVVVYENISQATDIAMPSENLSFRITSTDYSPMFEIESLGISGGKLWFSANRLGAGGRSDCIAYFNDYNADKIG